MALTTPNEGIDTPETAAKKLSKNVITQKVDEYMDAQSPNFFVEHKSDPLHGGVNSWESRITGYFKTKGENLDFSDDTSRNILSARIRGAILQRENLQRGVLQVFINHQFQKTFTYNGTPYTVPDFWGNWDNFKDFKNSELIKLRLSSAQRDKFAREKFLSASVTVTSAIGPMSHDDKKKAVVEFLQAGLPHDNDDKLLKLMFGGTITVADLNDDLRTALWKFENRFVIHADHIKAILTHLKDPPKQLAFIEYILPEISYKDAIEIDIIDKNIARHEILTVLRSSGTLSWPTTVDSATGALITPPAGSGPLNELDNLVVDDNFFSYFPLKLNNTHITHLSGMTDDKQNKLFAQIAKEHNERNMELELVESLKDPIKNRQDFMLALHDLAKEKKISLDVIREMEKLKKDSYFMIKKGDKEYYFRAGEITDTTLEFFDVGSSALGVRNDISRARKDPMDTYQKLYDSLKALGESTQSLSVQVYDETEFEQKKTNDKIPDASEMLTKNDLIEKLDELDKEGKGIDFEHPRGGGKAEEGNLSFEFDSFDTDDKGNRKKTFGKWSIEITKVDAEKREVTLDGGEPHSFEYFLYLVQEYKIRRVPAQVTPAHFLEDCKTQYTGLTDYKIDGSDIVSEKKETVKKDGKEEEKTVKLRYFQNKDGKLIYISSFGEGKVKIEQGKILKGQVGITPNSDEELEIRYLFTWMTSRGFFPCERKNQLIEPEPIKDTNIPQEQGEKANRKNSLWSAWMGMLSIGEILAGGKKVIESIEKKLTTANQLKAAKVASLFGHMFPESVRSHLQSMLEQEESATMEELMKQLTSVDSKVMVPRIRNILLNKNSEQYEIEAALFSMLSKYGALYNKEPMTQHRGSFLWYEALGGKIGDELFVNTKRDCENAKSPDGTSMKNQEVQPFTEEYLVEQLLKNQCKDPKEKGFIPPKRRSRIAKDMGKYMGQGIADELKDGEEKTNDIMTFEGRVDYCLSELNAGGYANAIGSLENIWKTANGEPQKDFMVPFIISASGVSANFPSAIMEKFKGFWGKSCTVMLWMNRTIANREKLQKAMAHMAESFKDPKLLADYNAIQKETNMSKKIHAAKVFWSKHGDKMVKRLNNNDYYLYQNQKNPDLEGYYDMIQGCETPDEGFKINADNVKQFLHKTKPILLTSGRVHMPEFMKGAFPGSLPDLFQTVLKDMYNELKALQSNSELKDEQKKKVFTEYYTLVHGSLIARGKDEYPKLCTHPDIENLKKLGMEFPALNYDAYTKDTEGDNPYERHDRYSVWGTNVKSCAQKFVENKGGIPKTTKDAQAEVFTSIEEIVSEVQNTEAANDDTHKKTA